MRHPAVVPKPPRDEYLYVLVCSDLSPGQQLAQTAHAVGEFAAEHPDVHHKWATGSRYLVVVAVPDAVALSLTAVAIVDEGSCFSLVCEPDLGGRPTSLAVIGTFWSRLGALPLAGRESAMA